jgi:D-alanine-D-alanine ligase
VAKDQEKGFQTVKILVLGGGDSPEREVSLRSAKSVAEAARVAGFEVDEADPKDGLEVLDGLSAGTIVFPILHGAGGEDGVLQAELEKRDLPFLGSGSEVSKKCFDKWQTREILEQNDIPMARAVRVNKESYKNEELSKSPHVLKIVHGGSSIGTLIVRDVSKVSPTQLDEIFALENDAVLETLIEGTEITIPILDQSPLPALEVRPPEGGEFDYANKYNGQSAELCPPPSLSEDQHQKSQRLAEQVHKIMKCRHLSRVDTIMRLDGSFVVLEINTIPGLTDQSLYPKAAQVAGMTRPQLVSKFVELVRRDYSI